MEYEVSHQHSKWSKCSTLPVELVTEILLRLPVKSLLKFRCVSKSCLALISSPQFIKSHLNLSAYNKDYAYHKVMSRTSQPERTSLRAYSLKSLLYESVVEVFDLNYPMNNPCISLSVVGSVDGLICLANRAKELFVWNPSIRKYKKLHDFRNKERHDYDYTYGFGYDDIHDDYKVVRIVQIFGGSPNFEVDIYSLKNDYWRSIDYPQDARVSDCGMFVNGKLHWAGFGLDRRWYIVYIDLVDDKWGKLEQPSYGEGDSVFVLGVCGSNLSMFCNNRRTHVDVWVMEEHGVKESWAKIFTIKDPQNPHDCYLSPSICMSNRGEFLLMFGSTFMICNPADDSIRFPIFPEYETGVVAQIYVESLVCPFAQNEPRIQRE